MDMIAENKDLIVKVIEHSAKAMANIAGDFAPLLSIAADFVKLVLDNVERKEVQLIQKQFQKLEDRLATFSEESQQIIEELKKNQVFLFYSSVENNLNNHFRRLMDIIDANDKYKKSRKDQFMDGFQSAGGKGDLNTLYNAVIGDHMFEDPVLNMVLNNKQKSRRPVEEFCNMLKNLFCVGLITLLAYTAMEGSVEKKLLQEWNKKMKVVQSKMDEVIAECINSFPTQAKLDAESIVRGRADKSNQELAHMLRDHLKKKFYWVCWSVRVFNCPTGLFANEKDFQGLMGKNLRCRRRMRI